MPKNLTLTCEGCGTIFKTYPAEIAKGRKYCSRACRKASIELRFWKRVIKTDTCWLWIGSINSTGYGTVNLGVHTVGAHCYSWVITNGPIVKGLQVLHACDNPPCVNPAHLFLGTAIDNMRDCVAKHRWANQYLSHRHACQAMP